VTHRVFICAGVQSRVSVFMDQVRGAERIAAHVSQTERKRMNECVLFVGGWGGGAKSMIMV
jgi:hypothetical protein